MNIIRDVSTPNQTVGRSGTPIDTIILHSTYGSYWGSVAWLKNPAAQASAHYIISRDGEIRKLVSEANTAWHAGNLAMNRRSIGIETTDDKLREITSKARESLIWLVADIKKRYTIKDIKFHRDVINTQCPYLDIRKEWFISADPLQECLRQHGELVGQVEDLKKQLQEASANFARQLSEQASIAQTMLTNYRDRVREAIIKLQEIK